MTGLLNISDQIMSIKIRFAKKNFLKLFELTSEFALHNTGTRKRFTELIFGNSGWLECIAIPALSTTYCLRIEGLDWGTSNDNCENSPSATIVYIRPSYTPALVNQEGKFEVLIGDHYNLRVASSNKLL